MDNGLCIPPWIRKYDKLQPFFVFIMDFRSSDSIVHQIYICIRNWVNYQPWVWHETETVSKVTVALENILFVSIKHGPDILWWWIWFVRILTITKGIRKETNFDFYCHYLCLSKVASVQNQSLVWSEGHHRIIITMIFTLIFDAFSFSLSKIKIGESVCA